MLYIYQQKTRRRKDLPPPSRIEFGRMLREKIYAIGIPVTHRVIKDWLLRS